MQPKKKKFRPVITRVKLNPEQAVLSCACYNQFNQVSSFTFNSSNADACSGKSVTFNTPNYSFGVINS